MKRKRSMNWQADGEYWSLEFNARGFLFGVDLGDGMAVFHLGPFNLLVSFRFMQRRAKQ